MDIFTLFPNKLYEFLELKQGGVDGNTVVKATSATGIVKIRQGITSNGYGEAYSDRTMQSASTVHIKPDEPFLSEVNNQLEGHGIRIAGDDFRIIGSAHGFDHEEDTVAFYKVFLKKESLASWDELDLPLS